MVRKLTLQANGHSEIVTLGIKLCGLGTEAPQWAPATPGITLCPSGPLCGLMRGSSAHFREKETEVSFGVPAPGLLAGKAVLVTHPAHVAAEPTALWTLSGTCWQSDCGGRAALAEQGQGPAAAPFPPHQGCWDSDLKQMTPFSPSNDTSLIQLPTQTYLPR